MPRRSPLRYSLPPQPDLEGSLTLITPLRTHRRHLHVANTRLTYSSKSAVRWRGDLTLCEIITPSFNTLSITLPNGKCLLFRVSKPELQLWYPRLMAACMGLNRHYRIGARLFAAFDTAVCAGCDRGDGGDVRVLSFDKAYMDETSPGRADRLARRESTVLETCAEVPGIINVFDVFEDCDKFHVVTDVFRGVPITDTKVVKGALKHVMKQLLQILCRLHDAGVTHGALDQATVVDGQGHKVWVMLYGYGRCERDGAMLADIRSVGAVMRRLLPGAEDVDERRVLEMLLSGYPAKTVLADAWFTQGFVEVDSPRTIVCENFGDRALTDV